MKVAIALSGGVDSTIAAYLLKKEGYDLIALFMQNWHDTTGTLYGDCQWGDDRKIAEMVAKKLEIPFHFVDLSGPYRERVVDYMFSEYRRGRTPNPDVLCNREIKFDLFLEAAKELGADLIATGHYAQKESFIDREGRKVYRLLRGRDKGKDQSYFLAQLTQGQLASALFPIGNLEKSEVRHLAKELDMPNADKKDSQGICFVGKIDLPTFLQQKLEAKEGDVVEIDRPFYEENRLFLASKKDLDHSEINQEKLALLSQPYQYSAESGKVIGKHRGAHFYTIGQRRGLNIGGHVEPLFVIGTDVEENLIFVGEGADHPGLLRRGLKLDKKSLNWVRPDLAIEEGEQLEVNSMIRYRQPLQSATLYRLGGEYYIQFRELQRGIAAGQFAAWYIDDELIGSAAIKL